MNKNSFFWVIVVFASFVFLFLLLQSIYSDSYIKCEGELIRNHQNLREVNIRVFLDREYKKIISKESLVIWYAKDDGSKYYGRIVDIKDENKKIKLIIKINQQDLKREFGNNIKYSRYLQNIIIYVEIFHKKIPLFR